MDLPSPATLPVTLMRVPMLRVAKATMRAGTTARRGAMARRRGTGMEGAARVRIAAMLLRRVIEMRRKFGMRVMTG